MTVLVIEVEGLALPGLLGDDRLANLRHLLEAGCHGDLRTGGSAARPADPGESILAGESEQAIRHLRIAPADWLVLDEEIGAMLAELDEGSAILIHSRAGVEDGFFLIAGARVPPAGRIDEVTFEDLGSAILRLAGMGGRGSSPLDRLLEEGTTSFPTDEQAEAIIQERLRGLGYIA